MEKKKMSENMRRLVVDVYGKDFIDDLEPTSAEMQRMADCIKEALENLSQADGQVISLRYQLESDTATELMEFRDIAEKMNYPIGEIEFLFSKGAIVRLRRVSRLPLSQIRISLTDHPEELEELNLSDEGNLKAVFREIFAKLSDLQKQMDRTTERLDTNWYAEYQKLTQELQGLEDAIVESKSRLAKEKGIDVEKLLPVLAESIFALELSARIFNALENAGVKTVRQLIEAKFPIRNIGKKSMEDIKKELADFVKRKGINLEIGMDLNFIPD